MTSYNDSAFVVLLLTMVLSPNKEEFARPYTAQEFYALEEKVRTSSLEHLPKLLHIDVSGLMKCLSMSEDEAYRLYTLLHRDVLIMRTLELAWKVSSDISALYTDTYPTRIRRKLGKFAPTYFYTNGDASLLNSSCVAILGISGVKTTPEIRNAVETIVKAATEQGYTIVTGGEPGVSRVAANTVAECGGRLLDILGGDMEIHMNEPPIDELLRQNRAEILSLEHPQAVLTIPHAVKRNRFLLSIADAAFIFNTDGKRGEQEALQNHTCNWIYAWAKSACNQPLLMKGAIALNDVDLLDFASLARRWGDAKTEQISLFDFI